MWMAGAPWGSTTAPPVGVAGCSAHALQFAAINVTKGARIHVCGHLIVSLFSANSAFGFGFEIAVFFCLLPCMMDLLKYKIFILIIFYT